MMDSSKNGFRPPNLICNFLSNCQKKTGESLDAVVSVAQLHFKGWNKRDNCSTEVMCSRSARFSLYEPMFTWKQNPARADQSPDAKATVPSLCNLSLEEQMRPWRENPVWTDPFIKTNVTVPEGSTCHLSLQVDIGLPPEEVYNIVTDPFNGLFKSAKYKNLVATRKVLIDEGPRQVIEYKRGLDWTFNWWSRIGPFRYLVHQNKEDFTVKFKLQNLGKDEGYWKMEPIYVDEHLCDPVKPTSVEDYVSRTKGKGRIGSRLSVENLMVPIVVDHHMFLKLKEIATENMKLDVANVTAKAAGIREERQSSLFAFIYRLLDKEGSDKVGDDDEFNNIKDRWAARREKSRHIRRSLNYKF